MTMLPVYLYFHSHLCMISIKEMNQFKEDLKVKQAIKEAAQKKQGVLGLTGFKSAQFI